MRVHALIDSLTWGGAEALLGDLAAGAPAAGIELSVGYLQERAGSPSARRLRAAGVEPSLAGTDSLLHPRDVARVRRQIAAARPDVVHTHLGYSDLLGGVAARSLGIPVVSTIHVTRWEPGVREAVKERLMSLARRTCAQRVVAVSESARALVTGAGWDRAGDVVVVHNGIAEPAPARPCAAVRAELGAGASDPVVAMAGVLRDGKGHREAIAAIDRLAAVVPGLRLWIVGDGPLRPAIDAAAAASAAVTVTGWREDVADLLAAADLVLHPTHADAFPTVLLEAMAAGLPVIATRTGGIPEIVSDGDTGVLIDPPPEPAAIAAALEPLLRDRGERARMGARARAEFHRRFTAERWAERLRALYDEVTAGASAGRTRSPIAAIMRSATRSQVKRSTSRS